MKSLLACEDNSGLPRKLSSVFKKHLRNGKKHNTSLGLLMYQACNVPSPEPATGKIVLSSIPSETKLPHKINFHQRENSKIELALHK